MGIEAAIKKVIAFFMPLFHNDKKQLDGAAGYLLLDEPTNALDKEGVIRIRQIIKEEAERGAVVIIASHN